MFRSEKWPPPQISNPIFRAEGPSLWRTGFAQAPKRALKKKQVNLPVLHLKCLPPTSAQAALEDTTAKIEALRRKIEEHKKKEADILRVPPRLGGGGGSKEGYKREVFSVTDDRQRRT